MFCKFIKMLYFSLTLVILTFNCCYADVESNSINENNSKFIEVKAEGIGESKINALKNAWSEAVRQAIGFYLISDEKIIDDELVENIATYSKGQVESYQLLKSDKQFDGWHIVILAKIEKDVLEEEIKVTGNQKQTFYFDGTNELANKFTKEEKKKNAVDVISSIDKLDIKDAIIYRSELRKEKIDGKNVNYIRHYIGLDVKKYLNKIDNLSKILEKIASSKKSFYFNNEALKDNKIAIDSNTMINIMKNEKFCHGASEHLCNLYLSNVFQGLTNRSEYDKSKRGNQCVVVVNSQSKLTIYCFDEDIHESIKCLQPKGLDLVFKIENQYGNIIAISDSFSILPAKVFANDNEVAGNPQGSLINLFKPYFIVHKTDRGGDNSFLQIFDQVFEMTDEELLNTKELSASYEITNDRELYKDEVCSK